MTADGLPTPRMMRETGQCIPVWSKAGCFHQTDIDPKKLIDLGHGDRPLLDLRYRRTNCGGKQTDWVVVARRTGPWRGTA